MFVWSSGAKHLHSPGEAVAAAATSDELGLSLADPAKRPAHKAVSWLFL